MPRWRNSTVKTTITVEVKSDDGSGLTITSNETVEISWATGPAQHVQLVHAITDHAENFFQKIPEKQSHDH